MTKPITAMIIMDGFGIRQEIEGNAIYKSGTPNLYDYLRRYPHTTIGASGMDVGLPDGQMGNSEVGHVNMGAGRIVYQELTRITKSIRDGDFFTNDALLQACASAKASGGKLHLMGLVSDGGVHSHNEHIYALIDLAKRQGLEDVYVHAFMDGRDVPPDSGREYLSQLQAYMDKVQFGKIATVSGRYYAMDRDKRWERVQKAYDALVEGNGETAVSADEAMAQSYAKGTVDEFVLPTVIVRGSAPTATIRNGDSVIFFNFRPDRARQLTRVLTEPDFAEVARASGFQKVHFVTMTQYDQTFRHVQIAFLPQPLTHTFSQVVSDAGLSQLRIAETEKYAHVTFFFSCGVEECAPGEDRALIASPKVATYDLQPEMSAYEVAHEAVNRIASGKYDVMILNFANCDMVGHTGVMEAAVKAVAAVDTCVRQVVEAVLRTGGNVIITADHGNAEMMTDPETNGPFTAHTTNRVPVILVGEKGQTATLRDDGILADLAPTLLDLLGITKPSEMTGRSLIV